MQRLFNHDCRADWNSRLVDDHGTWFQYRRNLLRGLLDIAEVGAAIGPLGRRDAKEYDVGIRGGSFGPEHELQAIGGARLVHHLFEAILDNRDMALVKQVDLALIDIAANDMVTKVSKARAGGQPDITSADYPESNRLW